MCFLRTETDSYDQDELRTVNSGIYSLTSSAYSYLPPNLHFFDPELQLLWLRLPINFCSHVQLPPPLNSSAPPPKILALFSTFDPLLLQKHRNASPQLNLKADCLGYFLPFLKPWIPSTFHLFNPLLHSVAYIAATFGQHFYSKMRRYNKKKFYERRVYESVDDNSLSKAITQKPTKKKLMQ